MCRPEVQRHSRTATSARTAGTRSPGLASGDDKAIDLRDTGETFRQGGRHGLRPRSVHRRLQNRRSTRDPGPPGANRCAPISSACSRNPDFIAAYCGDDQPRGREGAVRGPQARLPGARPHQRQGARVAAARSRRLLGDLRPGHQIHRHDRMGARGRRPDPKHAKLKPAKKYRLKPGQAGIYQDGAIHSIDYPDYARFVRVTGTNLDKINRIKIDLKTGEVEQIDAAARRREPARRCAPDGHAAAAASARRRRQSHARRRRRAGADRSARGADLLAQSSAVGAHRAAEPAGAALRRAGAAQGDAHRADRRQ